MKKTGQYDLIKIIAIFMVLILHYMNTAIGSGFDDTICLRGITTHTLEAMSIVACNLFVLVTSWFMVDTKKIKLKKVYDIVLLVIFYAFAVYLFSLFIGLTDTSIESIKQVYYTIFNRWFVTIYIILYLLIPLINKAICNFTKKEMKYLIIILISFFSIWPTFLTYVTIVDGGYGIINFIILYLIIYYVKKFTNYEKVKWYIYALIYIITTAITTVFSYYSSKAWTYNSIFVIIASISLFMLLSKIKLNRNKTIIYISSFSLSTYIIHENMITAKWLFQDIFKTDYYSHTSLLPVNLLITITSIFVICMIIEIIRRFIFKYTVNKLLDKNKFYNKTIEVDY